MLQGEISKKKTCPPLGNSLKYYRTSFVGTSTANQATDYDKTILAQKAGCLLALAENTLYEMKKTDSYQIFKDKIMMYGRQSILKKIIARNISTNLFMK